MMQELHLDELNSIEDEDEQLDHIEEVESMASDINNQGQAAQLAFLREQGYEADWLMADEPDMETWQDVIDAADATALYLRKTIRHRTDTSG